MIMATNVVILMGSKSDLAQALTNEPLRQRIQVYKEQMVAELVSADKEVYGQ